MRGRRLNLRRILFDADYAQHRTALAQLNIRTDAHFNRRGDRLSINERAEARVGIRDCAATFLQPKLGVLARDHRPLLLRHEVMADGRITSDHDSVTGERAFTMQLALTILCEYDLHRVVSVPRAVATGSGDTLSVIDPIATAPGTDTH